MTPLALLHAQMSIHRRGGATVWETCDSLLRDIAPEGDVIALTVPGTQLDRKLRQVIDLDRLFQHVAMPPSSGGGPRPVSRTAGEAHMAVHLGDEDRDIVHAPQTWPATPHGAAARVRTLDTLYASGHRPALIVIEDASAAQPLLAGAHAVLRRHSPIILIGLASCPWDRRQQVWNDCVEELKDFEYEWFDGLLLPCATAQRRAEFLDLNAGAVVCARRNGEDQRSRGPLPAGLLEASGLAALAWDDFSCRVGVDENRAGQLSAPFSDAIPAYGFHPAETDGAGTWWRWSGPSAHARVALPLPSAGRWFLTFEMFDWGVAKGAQGIDVRVAEKRLPCVQEGDGFARFGPVTISPRDAMGRLVVEIVTPPPRRASVDDPRLIGVNLSRFKLERAA